MIDIPPEDLQIIRYILRKYVPDCEIWAFGSRVEGNAAPHSDLDLVVIGKDKLPRITLAHLKADLEDAPIKTKVDLLDWNRISTRFQKNIKKHYEIVQGG